MSALYLIMILMRTPKDGVHRIPGGTTVNRTQLVDEVAARTGLGATSSDAVGAVLDAITEALAAGDKVTLPGFGVFEARPRPARTARNPRTGEPLEVAATTVPAFRAGSELKRRVAG